MSLRLATALILVALVSATVRAADSPQPTEDDHYKLLTFQPPEGVVLEVGGICLLPNGPLAVSTRRGDIYLVSNPFAKDPAKDSKFTLFAEGLHEVLGLAWKDGWLYATQRPEVTRLKDTTGDGRADRIETFCDGWDITGDYHEYAFGSPFDKDGNLWVVLCLTGSFTSNVPYRGWCVRIDKDGKLIPTCSGLRSPGGIGFNHEGDCFFTDNQGPWNGTSGLKWLRPGSFQGHDAPLRWYDLPAVKAAMGERPQAAKSGSRIMIEAKKIPQYEPPAILFPYNKMGKSASGIACDTTGKFGFKNQLFVGDQTHSTVMRCYLEKIKGHYQGVCFPFRKGIASGTLPLNLQGASMFIGSTSRGWGSRGNKEFGLQRLDFGGKLPFEINEMKVQSDGFVLTFTHPVDPKTAGDVSSYKMQAYTYIFQSSYGSPEVDQTTPTIERIEVAPDNKSARLYIKGLQEGHIHELHADGVRSAEGLPLLHPQAYYTLNYFPE